jgi:hypothetical protein
MTNLFLAAALGSMILTWDTPAAERPWQQITVPTSAQAARGFRSPPPEYGMVLWWFWNGPMTEAAIRRDLDEIQAHGVKSVLIWAYYGLEIEYLSDRWFERVRFAVAEAKRRDLRVWLMDEGSYPSGHAGGRITKEHPDQRMKALVVGKRIPAEGGRAVALDLPPETLGAWATERASGRSQILEVSAGRIRWTPPAGTWEISPIAWQYRTPPVRNVGNPGFPKNTAFSLFDFLDPDATRLFLRLVHERYQRAIGAEFGRTVMGFMSDETDCADLPWTARSLDEFERRKGYDLRPQLPRLFNFDAGEASRRVRADYWDVWSNLLRENFYQVQTEWCARNGLEYIVHLNAEDDMKALVRLSGDYFRSMRHVQVPGIDAIWRQIWPGTVADFPKLASSAAHLYGRPRAFTESYAVYGRGLSLEQAKWVMDQQLVRGINLFQTMLFLSDSREYREYFHPPDWRLSPQWAQFSQFSGYANRTTYLLSLGRPAARTAVFFPTTGIWLGDDRADAPVWQAARVLLEAQQDFDFIDEQALGELATVEKGGLRNRSGQVYTTVVLPPAVAISTRSLEQLRAFAAAGGRVLFLDRPPALAFGRSFRDAVAPPPPGFGEVVSTASLARLPGADVRFERPVPAVKYLHRQWRDAGIYFFFNEGSAPVAVGATLAGSGSVRRWDAATGQIRTVPSTPGPGGVSLTLRLGPSETCFLEVGRAALPGALPEAPVRVPLRTVQELSGEWQVSVAGQDRTARLRPWSEWGIPAFSGRAVYRREFTWDAASAAPGEVPTLDLGEVRYSARVRLNGVDLGDRAWAPFRWDLGRAMRPGRNQLVVEVLNTAANELSGDAAHLREIEDKGWLKNAYFRTYGKFDAEMVPSGLLGPVRLQISR